MAKIRTSIRDSLTGWQSSFLIFGGRPAQRRDFRQQIDKSQQSDDEIEMAHANREPAPQGAFERVGQWGEGPSNGVAFLVTQSSRFSIAAVAGRQQPGENFVVYDPSRSDLFRGGVLLRRFWLGSSSARSANRGSRSRSRLGQLLHRHTMPHLLRPRYIAGGLAATWAAI